MRLIRPIEPGDVDAVASYAIRTLEALDLPLHVSPRKVRAHVEHFTRPNGDFNLVAFDGERVVGAIAAVVSEMPWFERCEAQVVLCKADVPWAGLAFLRSLKAWAVGDMRIRRLSWAHNAAVDPRVVRLGERLGFSTQALGVWTKE